MKRTTNLLFTLAVLLCLGSCSTTADSLLQIECPKTFHVKIPDSTATLDSSALPEPRVISHCDFTGYQLVRTVPPIHGGANTIAYWASNDCGDSASCTFSVEAEVDFRARFVGTYLGYRDCGASNTTQQHADQLLEIEVGYSKKADHLIVGTDDVEVLTDGSFPYPYFGDYRMYALSFRQDSIFILQQWGVINAHETCVFKGKKL